MAGVEDDVRTHARKSALAGRPVFSNPHIGGEAEIWREGYYSVPEAQRGSQPELLSHFRSVHTRKRKPGGFKVNALGFMCLKGSTPKPCTET